jgi:hypothetical protein
VVLLRSLSHLAWFGIVIILSDTLANLIVYVNVRSDYLSSCISSASGVFENELTQAFQGLNNISMDSSADFYNCSRLWTDELKLSILVVILMMVIYVSPQDIIFCQWCRLLTVTIDLLGLYRLVIKPKETIPSSAGYSHATSCNGIGCNTTSRTCSS